MIRAGDDCARRHSQRAISLALAVNLLGGNVIKNKVDSALSPFIHDAVLFLIINFIHFANLHLLGSAVDHKTYPAVGVNGNVNTVPVVKGRVLVVMRLDNATGL